MNKKYIERIYNLAKESYDIDEIPVGAIVVKDDKKGSFYFLINSFTSL